MGERTNANGSRKFRDLLAANDYDGLVAVARDQQREGAHMLDVCVAFTGRDEPRDMAAFLDRLVPQTLLPLMVDSTEVPAIEDRPAPRAGQVRGQLHQLRGRRRPGPEGAGPVPDLRRGPWSG